MATLREHTYRQLFNRAEDGGRPTLTSYVLVIIILVAVTVSILSTDDDISAMVPGLFNRLEVAFGLIFGVEYAARVWSVADSSRPGSVTAKRLRFIASPIGLIDLVVVVASLAPVLFSDAAILRLVRLVRIVAIAKFGRFSRSMRELGRAIAERKFDLAVTMALAGVLLLVGATAMHWAEGDIQPEAFGSIPRSLWWSIITLTTVGYGDVSPITPLGKVLASVVALSGIGLVAMPTGIMAAAFSEAMARQREAERESEDAADL